MFQTTEAVEPAVGDIWLDEDGQHNLILRIYYNKMDSKMVVHILTIDTGEYWDHNPLADFAYNKYFYVRVG